MSYQVARLTFQHFAELGQGREPDRAGMAILEDRHVHDGYLGTFGQLGQGHASVSQELVEVYLDRVVRLR